MGKTPKFNDRSPGISFVALNPRSTCLYAVVFASADDTAATLDDAIKNLLFFLSLINSELEPDDYLSALSFLQQPVETKSQVF